MLLLELAETVVLDVLLLVGVGVEGGEPLFVRVVVAVREGVGVPVDESNGVKELVGVEERLAPMLALAVAVCAALGVGEGVTRPVPEPLCEGDNEELGGPLAMSEAEPEPVALGVGVRVGVPLAVSELVGEGVTRPVPEPLCDGVGDCVAVTEGVLLGV